MNKYLLQAMALDFKRAAMAYHSGSTKTADIFLNEVLKRLSQLNEEDLPHSLRHLIQKIPSLTSEHNLQRKSEDSLLYSTILLSFAK